MSDQECDSTVSRYGDATYMGRVKWFNRVAGWGFVSVVGGVEEGWKQFQDDEVFVHWKSLEVGKEQYRYLVNGEYITFTIAYSQNSNHKYQAQSVRGINGGILMCETRNERSGAPGAGEDDQERQSGPPMQVRPRGGGPREGQQGEQWFLVKQPGGQTGSSRRGRGGHWQGRGGQWQGRGGQGRGGQGRGGEWQGRGGEWQEGNEQTPNNESA